MANCDQSGTCTLTIDKHTTQVTTAAWTPDGQYFITGTLEKEACNSEKRGQLYLWNLESCQMYRWAPDHRIQDLAISPDGQKLVLISSQNAICVYNFITREEEYTINVAHRMTCISISRDSKHMLVNMANDEVHLIDIETADIVRRYLGQPQDNYVIRSSFGGADEGLVVSGSSSKSPTTSPSQPVHLTAASDSKVYIWHKANGTLIETLEGHAYGCVNSVSWNPANPGMFASGGDDRKVRMYVPPLPLSLPSPPPEIQLQLPLHHL